MMQHEVLATDLSSATYLHSPGHPLQHLTDPPSQRRFALANVAEKDIAALSADANVHARQTLSAPRDPKGVHAQRGERL